ncbi:hypothetical protein Sta7437_1960 [Stanieria cyanosphaera PCC 7437]|uniref:Uncharacterized protein n=1 Tax=Stanieria cyanosphaera (strain ATCC 29371 / PCC 7437) TaxID=111780 RepID=K9XTX3_STAC7|nr:hypothetical protein [Stanieria cyanosphaera]AFZ35514.1 hypothetical protein Sta7437_1960 [Stanieria cyanosphaera PCC 7437]
MLCTKCQRQVICMVYQLGQEDSRIKQMLSQMNRCEQRQLVKSH